MSEEDVWRQRLTEAERRHRDAIKAYVEAVESGGDEVAIAAAAERRSAAREEYYRTLRVFSGIVLRGKPPPAT
jgi:hypothetical protein